MILPPLLEDGLPEAWPQDHGIGTLAPDALAWSETELAQPDGDGAGGEWQWRETQARYVSWWYAVDEVGRWLWRRGQIVLPKGAGKSPLAAALSCIELAGPVKFDGFDASGDPVGRPHPSPWVQLAAVSQEQTDNTMSLVLAMLREGNASKTVRGLDVGITRVRTASGVLQPVTASAPSREGQRTTAAILDETHLWNVTNGGKRLAATIRRNLGKMAGRSIETTNTWIPGELSVAEDTAEYARKGAEGLLVDAADPGVLRWHPQAHVTDMGDPVALRAGLESLYGDAPWVDVSRIMDEVYDLGTDPEDAQRFYLNQITSASDAWISAPEWQGCLKRDAPPVLGDIVVLGFDGSRGRAKGKPDASALVGCRVADGHMFEVAVWEALDSEKSRWDTWEPPLVEIEATIADCFDRYNVVGFYADPAKDWRSYVDGWESRWGSQVAVKSKVDHPFEWWMTGGRSGLVQQAVEQFEGAIRNKDMSHDGSLGLTRHMLNARRRVSHGKLALGKSSDYSERKIDAAVAGVLAWQARLDALAKGVGQQTDDFFMPYRIR